MFTKKHIVNLKKNHWSKTGSYYPPTNRIKKICLVCKKEYEIHRCNQKTSKVCSNECRYKYQSFVAKPQLMTDRLKKKISETKRKNREGIGDKNPNWKGGATKEIAKGRSNWQFYEWRQKVLKRDNYICQICGKNKKETKLEAHHKKIGKDIKN